MFTNRHELIIFDGFSGARFGRMQTKVGLVKILQNHTVDVCEKTDKNYELDQNSFLLTPKNGVYVKIIK